MPFKSIGLGDIPIVWVEPEWRIVPEKHPGKAKRTYKIRRFGMLVHQTTSLAKAKRWVETQIGLWAEKE